MNNPACGHLICRLVGKADVCAIVIQLNHGGSRPAAPKHVTADDATMARAAALLDQVDPAAVTAELARQQLLESSTELASILKDDVRKGADLVDYLERMKRDGDNTGRPSVRAKAEEQLRRIRALGLP